MSIHVIDKAFSALRISGRVFDLSAKNSTVFKEATFALVALRKAVSSGTAKDGGHDNSQLEKRAADMKESARLQQTLECQYEIPHKRSMEHQVILAEKSGKFSDAEISAMEAIRLSGNSGRHKRWLKKQQDRCNLDLYLDHSVEKLQKLLDQLVARPYLCKRELNPNAPSFMPEYFDEGAHRDADGGQCEAKTYIPSQDMLEGLMYLPELDDDDCSASQCSRITPPALDANDGNMQEICDQTILTYSYYNDDVWMDYCIPFEVITWTKGSTGVKKYKSLVESQDRCRSFFSKVNVDDCSDSDSESERKELRRMTPCNSSELDSEQVHAMLARQEGVRLKFAKRRKESWAFQTQSNELRELEKLERAFCLGDLSSLSQEQLAIRQKRALYLRAKYETAQ